MVQWHTDASLGQLRSVCLEAVPAARRPPAMPWAQADQGRRTGCAWACSTGVPKRLNTSADISLSLTQRESRFWQDEFLTPGQCKSERVLRLHDYWRELLRGRSMPARRDIDATQIWLLLPNIHVSEWYTNPDRVRCRVAGTEVVASLGFEIGGRWLEEYHTDPEDFAETMALFRRVAGHRAPVLGRTHHAALRLGVDSFEWILCPLSDDDRTVTHFIGLEDYVSNRRYLGAGQ